MAFNFGIGTPGELEYTVDGDPYLSFDLGIDAELGELVEMMVALIEDDGPRDPHVSPNFELIFGITITDIELEIRRGPFFDHQTARRFVSRGNAEVVMLLILSCVGLLMQKVAPSTVTMQTAEANLVAPAMAKYTRVSNRMGLCGYEQTEYRRDPNDLKDYWLFKLP